MSPRPRIGVTLSAHRNFWIWLLHAFAIWRAGGWPVKLTSRRPHTIDGLDALVVGGGDDISFQLDGTELHPNIRYDPDRDKLEKELLEKAFEVRLPVLGICRGAQMINLVRGGNLFTDLSHISDAAPRGRMVLPKKRITLKEGSRLAEIMACERCKVNALHHQAVNGPGDGLDIVAHDEHGIVQAIEGPSYPFLLGVQWHPELLPFSASSKNIFRALVRAAAEKESGVS